MYICLKSLNQVCIECGLALKYQNYCTDANCKNYNLIKNKIKLCPTSDKQLVFKLNDQIFTVDEIHEIFTKVKSNEKNLNVISNTFNPKIYFEYIDTNFLKNIQLRPSKKEDFVKFSSEDRLLDKLTKIINENIK